MGSTRIRFDRGADERVHERLGWWPAPKRRAHELAALHGKRADRFVFAGEIVVEGAGGDACGVCDVLDVHVLEAALHSQPQRSDRERLAGRRFLALAQAIWRAVSGLTWPTLGEFAARFGHACILPENCVMRKLMLTFTLHNAQLIRAECSC